MNGARGFVVSLLLMAATTGCVAQPGSSGAPAESALKAEWKLPDSEITLAPPGVAVAKMTGDAAYDVCTKSAGSCNFGQPTAVQLAVATDTGSGQLDAQGKLVPLLNKTLVWAISWIGITCPPHSGGPPVSSPLNAAASEQLCDKVAFVDATTGAFIFDYSYPHQ
jgi:hypothetical protein